MKAKAGQHMNVGSYFGLAEPVHCAADWGFPWCAEARQQQSWRHRHGAEGL